MAYTTMPYCASEIMYYTVCVTVPELIPQANTGPHVEKPCDDHDVRKFHLLQVFRHMYTVFVTVPASGVDIK